MEQYDYNHLVYRGQFNFEPIVGEIYQLYRDSEGAPFLSIIKPDECNFDFIGSFRLTAKMWEKLKNKIPEVLWDFFEVARRDSNPDPLGVKPSALNQLSYAPCISGCKYKLVLKPTNNS